MASKVLISLLRSWNGMEWNLDLSSLTKIHRPARLSAMQISIIKNRRVTISLHARDCLTDRPTVFNAWIKVSVCVLYCEMCLHFFTSKCTVLRLIAAGTAFTGGSLNPLLWNSSYVKHQRNAAVSRFSYKLDPLEAESQIIKICCLQLALAN